MKARKLLLILLFCVFAGYLFSDQTGTVTTSLNLRSAPHGDKVTVLSSDEKVTILDEKEGWYKVERTNGTTGWASGKYIEVSKEDKSEEKLFSDGEEEKAAFPGEELDEEDDDIDIWANSSSEKTEETETDQPAYSLPETEELHHIPAPDQPLPAGDKDFASGYDTPESGNKREADINAAIEGIEGTIYKYYEIKYQDAYSEIEMYYKGEIKEEDVIQHKRRLQKYYKVFYAKDDVAKKRPLREILFVDYIKTQITTYTYFKGDVTKDGKPIPHPLVVIHYKGDREGKEEMDVVESFTYDTKNKLANVRFYQPYRDVFRPKKISFYTESRQVYFTVFFNEEGVRIEERYYEGGTTKEIHRFLPARAPQAGGAYRIERFYTEKDLIEIGVRNYTNYVGNYKSIAEYFKKGMKSDDITYPVTYKLPEINCNRFVIRKFSYEGYLDEISVLYVTDKDQLYQKKVTGFKHEMKPVLNEEGEIKIDAYGNEVQELVYSEGPTLRYNADGKVLKIDRCDCEPVMSLEVDTYRIADNPKYYSVDREGVIDKDTEFRTLQEAQTFRDYYLVYFRTTQANNRSEKFNSFVTLRRSKEIIGTLPFEDEGMTETERHCPQWAVNQWKVDFAVYYEDNQIEKIIYYDENGKIFRVDFYEFNPNNEVNSKQIPYRYFYHMYAEPRIKLIEEIGYNNPTDPLGGGVLDYIIRYRDDGKIDLKFLFHVETYNDGPDLVDPNSFVNRKFKKLTDWAVLRRSKKLEYGRDVHGNFFDKHTGLVTKETRYIDNIPREHIYYKYSSHGKEVLKREEVRRPIDEEELEY